MKICSKCALSKTLDFFSLNKRGLHGRRAECKSCQKIYRVVNKGKIKSLNKQWKKANPPSSRSLDQQEKIKQYKRNYHQQIYKNLSNLEKLELRKRKKEFEYKKRRSSLVYKIKGVLRSRLNQAIKNNQKVGSAVRDLGCSIEELKKHLESQFKLGMTWDNWSKSGWHIDHIEPLSSFNLTDPYQLKRACYYTNLQPLWAKDNLRKSNK